jgi:hypothetical protein
LYSRAFRIEPQIYTEQYGYVLDGGMPTVKETAQPENNDTHLAEVNSPLRQALKTKAFWILVIAITLVGGFRILV